MPGTCPRCKEIYRANTFCNNCYTKYIEHVKDYKIQASETEEKLKCQIEDLNSTLTFLRSSVNNPLVSPPPFSDIVLVASDDPSPLSISANRAILACRSPVFRAMLENEMEESISGIIKIGEVSNDILGMFVNFMYTGEAANLDEKIACDLLMLGVKYQIPHLNLLREVLEIYSDLGKLTPNLCICSPKQFPEPDGCIIVTGYKEHAETIQEARLCSISGKGPPHDSRII